MRVDYALETGLHSAAVYRKDRFFDYIVWIVQSRFRGPMEHVQMRCLFNYRTLAEALYDALTGDAFCIAL